jgi:hypothetical protein
MCSVLPFNAVAKVVVAVDVVALGNGRFLLFAAGLGFGFAAFILVDLAERKRRTLHCVIYIPVYRMQIGN